MEKIVKSATVEVGETECGLKRGIADTGFVIR